MGVVIGVWFVVFCVCLIFLLLHSGLRKMKEMFDDRRCTDLDDIITGILSLVFALIIASWLIRVFT